MILQIMCIRDRAADAFGTPFFVPSVGLGIRSFTTEVNRSAPENPIYNHPGDFDLYHLGTYHDDQAHFELLTAPRMVAIGKDVSASSTPR